MLADFALAVLILSAAYVLAGVGTALIRELRKDNQGNSDDKKSS